MRLVVDCSVLSPNVAAPAACLINSVEDPLRICRPIARRREHAELLRADLPNAYGARISSNRPEPSLKVDEVRLEKPRPSFRMQSQKASALPPQSDGLVLDAAACVALEEQLTVKVYSFDDYADQMCMLRYFSDENMRQARVASSTIANIDGDVPKAIFGVQTVDCRPKFEVMSILGSSVYDISEFTIRHDTRAILIAVFAVKGMMGTQDCSGASQSLVELISTNTTVTGVEPCMTLLI